LDSRIKVLDPSSDFMKKIITLCPIHRFAIEQDKVMMQREGCIECCSCSKETDWKHPCGGRGVNYQYV
jgi:electron transfer flavoprotein-quinone oxidoreductase